MAVTVELRDYVDRIFSELEKAHNAQLQAAEKALGATAMALEARLETMNQFRSQIQEERGEYVRRDQLDPLLERLRKVEDRGSNMDGRFWALGIGLTIGLGIFTTILNVILRLIK